MHNLSDFLYKNLANAVSLLGVLPLCVLFREDGYQYLIPLMIFSNIMDDLDGILAGKLDIRSEFGAMMDNVCDAIAHSVFAMVVGMQFGGVCAAASLVGAAAIVWRSVSRLVPGQTVGTGSATNELIRHVLFVLLLAQIFEFYAAPYLVAAFLFHAVSMLLPYRLPYLIRGMTKSALAIGLVNVALLVAWLVPTLTSVIAASFIITYAVSLMSALIQRDKVASLGAL